MARLRNGLLPTIHRYGTDNNSASVATNLVATIEFSVHLRWTRIRIRGRLETPGKAGAAERQLSFDKPGQSCDHIHCRYLGCAFKMTESSKTVLALPGNSDIFGSIYGL